MNQFKDVFLGNETRPYRRAASSQKCMRVSGKHNDFRDVGHSTRHHTFFEMLGNFSFGDYFKQEAIHYAWEMLTREYGLDRLWITVFECDDTAWEIWHRQENIPESKILRLGEKDNFWAMGDTGPCGPCSEIHYDFGKSPLPDHGDCDLTCSCGRWIEVWNLVFMQYNRDSENRLNPLPSPSIDTGMGFERITAVLQNCISNYDTDLFHPLLEEVSNLSNLEYGTHAGDDVSMRIIADHARAAAFVIADGQFPGNDKRGYVLRKILRRAMVHGKRLGMNQPFIYRIAGTVVEIMKDAYPELVQSRETIARVVKQEEDSFADTLGEGLRDFNERIKKLKAQGSRVLPGEEAFFLYDTRGLPLEIIEDLARENGLLIDEAGFAKALELQRERSRRDYMSGKIRMEVARTVFEEKTEFVGYEIAGEVDAVIQAIVVDGERAESIEAGQMGEVVLNATPFYAEAGGQVGDTGFLTKEDNKALVTNTLYRSTAISHLVQVQAGSFQVGDRVKASVDLNRRALIMKNHTATHLLQAALRRVLGAHVKQAGSLVAPDRLRFDFTHYAPLTPVEMQKVEDLVNEQIWLNLPVVVQIMMLDEAISSGAVALFGEKYQEQVRVVQVPGFSKELCGGTHVPATGTIGLFKIISEEGIAAGIRRIEALTGPTAFARFRAAEQLLDRIQSENKVVRHEILAWIEKLKAQVRDLQRRVSEFKIQSARSAIGQMLASCKEVQGVKVIAELLPGLDRANLRNLADELKHKVGSGIVVLGSVDQEKAALVVMVTDDLSKRLSASQIVKQIAPIIGGAGGGKPELAEAGGKEPSKLADAIKHSYVVIESMMSK